MILTLLDFLNGLFSLLFVIISTLVGLKIASKYRDVKYKGFLYVGLGWAGISSAWYPSSISFLCVLIIGRPLDSVAYFLIGNVLLHLVVTLYLVGITDMIYKTKQKKIVGIFVLIGIVYNCFFYYFLFTDPTVIGDLELFDVSYKTFVRIYLIFIIATVYILSMSLGIKSFKSDDREVKLKGKFILLSINLYLIGAVLDATITLTTITLIITRTVLITSSILIYIGFLLPNKIKNFFLRENRNL